MLRWTSCCAFLVAISLASLERTAEGQGGIPPLPYYNGLRLFYDGQYYEAARTFKTITGVRTPQSRWIDSICYETMLGECFFQTGDLDTAVQHYTAALLLVKQYPDWMTLVRFDSAIRPAGPGARKIVPWGASKRQSILGYYPASVPIIFSQGIGAISSTFMVPQTNMITINVQEIVRCTTLALRRRAMILGPVSRYDPLSNELVAALNRAITPPNHWSQCWADLERALALIAAGREAQAGGPLRLSVTAGAEFDHPMTSVALLELGRQALLRGEYPAAAGFFEEATYSAVNYPQYCADFGVLEEAFRYLMVTRLLSNNRTYFAPLDRAIVWAKSQKLRQLQASLLLCAAENHAILGQTAQAVTALDEARQIVGAEQGGRHGDRGGGRPFELPPGAGRLPARPPAAGRHCAVERHGLSRSAARCGSTRSAPPMPSTARSLRGPVWTFMPRSSAIPGPPTGLPTRWNRWPSSARPIRAPTTTGSKRPRATAT